MSNAYRLASNDLVCQTKQALQNASENCVDNGLTISASHKENSLSIINILQPVTLNSMLLEQASTAVFENRSEFFVLDSKNTSLGKLIEECGSFKSAKEKVEALIHNLKRSFIEPEVIDYFEEVRFCLEVSSKYIRESAGVKRTADTHFQDFCSLCWRLVNKYKYLNFSDSEFFSQHYCIEHHPKANPSNYAKVRQKLIREVKRHGLSVALESKDFLDSNDALDLIDNIKTLNRDSVSRHLYRLFDSLADRPNYKKYDLLLRSSNSWHEFAEVITQEVIIDYPTTAAVLPDIDISAYNNWAEWFLAIIEALGTREDTGVWYDSGICPKTAKHKSHLAISNNIGWRVLLKVISRYDAYQKFIIAKRKPGPESKQAIKP
tara:strand:- start:2238 stop:3368 length:1131 start_codon:yes stop_codon:yes gene_type:complete